MKKQKRKSFRKGQFVRSGNTIVLVTGAGNKKEAGYPCFAGVVLADKKQEYDEFSWSVGTYFDTWLPEAFKKMEIKVSKLIAEECL